MIERATLTPNFSQSSSTYWRSSYYSLPSISTASRDNSCLLPKVPQLAVTNSLAPSDSLLRLQSSPAQVDLKSRPSLAARIRRRLPRALCSQMCLVLQMTCTHYSNAKASQPPSLLLSSVLIPPANNSTSQGHQSMRPRTAHQGNGTYSTTLKPYLPSEYLCLSF